MSLGELLLILLLVAAFLTFVWWLWREDYAYRAIPDGRHATRNAARAPAVRAEPRASVLFVCTHNSARSQMAEALLRDMAGDRLLIASAGTAPTRIHPLADAVMANRGLSLQSHRSKSLSEVGSGWDYVITLCDQAFEECPEFPAKTCHLHWSIEDPARPKDSPAQELDTFCRVRDDLALRLRGWLAERQER